MGNATEPTVGKLAATAGQSFPLGVLHSAAGYYLGTATDDGLPYSRESVEYWPSAKRAHFVLLCGTWTQRQQP